MVLSAGEADIEVTPGLPGHFRVVTPRFVVEVLGTRFVVDMQSVRTLRGRVHVLDGAGGELAALSAGARWNLSEGRPAAGTSPVVSPEAATGAPSTPETAGPAEDPPGAKQAPSPPAAMGELRSRGATQRKQPAAAAELLTRSRAALARGDARQARALAQHALASAPSDRELAAGHLLLADSLLVDGRPGDAVEAYRRVVKRWSRAPEAELAQFAIGQLLMERGAKPEAAVAFNDYLARFPLGRFVREAREHLALLRSGP
jgi:TolA-binding protein